MLDMTRRKIIYGIELNKLFKKGRAEEKDEKI